jgi:Flp pilus assembly protein TadD
MKCSLFFAAVIMFLALAGCKPKEITPLQRKEAASVASEAQFAVTMRDYARARPLFEKATQLCPDDGEYWLGLGIMCRRLNDNSAAKAAYEKARSAYHETYDNKPAEVEALLQELYALALLGRLDEAQGLLAKAVKQHPEDSRLRAFADNKQLDRVVADPSFKEIAL